MNTVSIPSTLMKTIQSIKEMTGNHSDEDVYAMLKECSMDPNETVQKLLLQDTFHEVKRKRDRRKENLSNKEPIEHSWRSGTHGRGSRGGRVNYMPLHISHDVVGGRIPGSGKENGNNQVLEKAVAPSQPTLQEPKDKEVTVASSDTVMANGPMASGSTGVKHPSGSSAGRGINLPELSMPSHEVTKLDGAPASSGIVDAKTTPAIVLGSKGVNGQQPAPTSSNCSVSKTSDSLSAACFLSSDPVVLPSSDPWLSATVGTTKREVGSQQNSVEPNANLHALKRPTSACETRSQQGKMPEKSPGVVKNSFSESSRPKTASSHRSSSSSRPSSNYNNRTQVIGAQRVNSNKEWKPKSMNSRALQGLASGGVSEVPAVSVEGSGQSQHVSSAVDSNEATSKLERKVDELHIERKQVILPNHIRVPESERLNLSFGSFGSSFVLPTSNVNVPESEKTSTPQSEASQISEENAEEQSSSNQNAIESAPEEDYPDKMQPATEGPETLPPAEEDVSSSPVPDHSEPEQESGLPTGGLQYPTVHASPNYNFGIVTPNLGGQLAPVEASESQEREVSHLQNIVVQPPVDATSYYAQFYRSAADGDGRMSPFHAPGVAKYNGNVAVFPLQMTQTQESANSLVLPPAAPTPLVTQAAGLTQSSTMAVTQQPLPIFRPQAGMPLSHFPANYIPYGHYYPPFYVAPSGIHHFLNNSPFPPQPQSVYTAPSPAAATATGIKYPLPQYKLGTNTGNSTHTGVPNSFGPYGSSPGGYNTSSATAGNSTTNEDLDANQFKENNIYVTGQQNEGSAVWAPTPSRDVSSLPTGSYYNLPSHGAQHVTFTPTQASHGSYGSLYHPAQAVTAGALHPFVQQPQTIAGGVDMVGATPSIYQQHSQSNWSGNF